MAAIRRGHRNHGTGGHGTVGLTDINQMNALKVVLTIADELCCPVVWFIIGKGVVGPRAGPDGRLYVGLLGWQPTGAAHSPRGWRAVGGHHGLVISIQLFWKQAHS